MLTTTGASCFIFAKESSWRVGRPIFEVKSMVDWRRITAITIWRKRKRRGRVGEELRTALLLHVVGRVNSYLESMGQTYTKII